MKKIKQIFLVFSVLALAFCFFSCDLQAQISDYAIDLIKNSVPDDEITFVSCDNDETYTFYSKDLDQNFTVVLQDNGTFVRNVFYYTNYFALKYQENIEKYFKSFFIEKGFEEGKDYVIVCDSKGDFIQLNNINSKITDFETYKEIKSNSNYNHYYSSGSLTTNVYLFELNTADDDSKDKALCDEAIQFYNENLLGWFFYCNVYFCEDLNSNLDECKLFDTIVGNSNSCW